MLMFIFLTFRQMKYNWNKVNIGFGLESTRGTKVSPAIWFPKTDFNFETRTERQEDESSLGVKADAVDSYITKKFWDGTFGGYINANNVGILLKALLGKDTVSEVVASTVYSHLIQVEETQEAPTLTACIDEPNGDYSFPLAFIKSMTISINREEAKVSVEMMSKVWETDNHTAWYVQDYRFKPDHTLFKIAQNLAGLSWASGACIQTFEMTIARSFEEDFCLNTGTDVKDLVTGRYTITGSITAVYDNETTYKNPALNDEAKAMSLKLEDTDTDLGSGNYPSIEFVMPKVKFVDWGRDVQADGTIKQNVSFKAFYDVETSKYIDITLQNTTSSY